MLCQDCKKREAQVHLTQVVNNEKLSIALCKECGAARGFHSPLDNVPFPLAEILSGLAENIIPVENEMPPQDDLVCDGCGQTFEQFTRQGRFGCGDCYSAFRPRLETIMRKIHGASIHRGRIPEFTKMEVGERPVPVKEESRIEDELKNAIESEDFERAAELRDKLKSVRDKISVEETTRG